jgi:hypothetical protein
MHFNKKNKNGAVKLVQTSPLSELLGHVFCVSRIDFVSFLFLLLNFRGIFCFIIHQFNKTLRDDFIIVAPKTTEILSF